MKTTPNHIHDLTHGQVFVFGSNDRGAHAGGAARQALESFGAEWGIARGLRGQSYAIPTMDADFDPLSLDQIAQNVAEFYAFASEHPEREFLVTAIGCGIAGFSPEKIAPMFAACGDLPNVSLPASFIRILEGHR